MDFIQATNTVLVPPAKWASFAVMTDKGFDVLREFWPEIARKLRIPFREKPPTDQQSPRL